MAEYTSYEVSALLAIRDGASAPMERVIALARDIEKEFARIKELGKGLFSGSGINRFVIQLDRVNPAVNKVAAQMDMLRGATVGALDGMDTALLATTDLIRGMKTELGEAATFSKAMRVPMPGSFGGGGHSGGKGPPGERISTPYGGGPISMHTAGIIAGGAMAFGAYEESKLRDTVARALFLSRQPLSGMDHSKQFEALRKQMLDVYTLTGANLDEIEGATLGTVKLMAGFPLDKRMEVLKTALTFGAQENRLNPKVSAEQGAEALVRLIHMTGKYDPAEIAKLTPKIAALSTVTDLPLSTVTRAASYSMPIAQANLGVDADQILLLITAMQRAGITSTKSGTWLREAITKTITDTFTLTKHGSKEQKIGLRQLGLLDEAGHSTVIDSAGHLDMMKEMEILNQARQRLLGPAFLKDMRQAFGAQGSEGWAILTEPQVIQQLPQLRKWMTEMPGGEQLFKDLFDASTLQQGKSTLAEFNRSLMDVGAKALPAASQALKVFDSALHGLNFTLEHMGVPSGAAEDVSSWAMLGGAALLMSRTLQRGAGWALGKAGQLIFGGGGAAAAAEAAAGPSSVATAAAAPEAAAVLAGVAGGSLLAGSVGVGIGAIAGVGNYFGNQYLRGQSGGTIDPYGGIVDPQVGIPFWTLATPPKSPAPASALGRQTVAPIMGWGRGGVVPVDVLTRRNAQTPGTMTESAGSSAIAPIMGWGRGDGKGTPVTVDKPVALDKDTVTALASKIADGIGAAFARIGLKVEMDAREVGKLVAEQIARVHDGPHSSPQGFDPTMNFVAP